MKNLLRVFFRYAILLVVGPVLAAPLPVRSAPAAITLIIDAAQDRHAISPYIYGMNYAIETLAAELRLPVRRWGGNSTTRYNWQNNTYNTGSDWYFENIVPDTNSSSDAFVQQDRRTGTRTLMTVPTLGWVAKNSSSSHPFSCGFKVSQYGPQQSVDPWDTDCGNGIRTNGTNITGNDPRDTSISISPTFVQNWVSHFVSTLGAASAGGVQFYDLDNEPMLWNSTHRDVHPQPLGYDELLSRTVQYASAIKAADPSAQTLGPAEWGWTNYFFSALDAAPGGAWWSNPLDRNAHGATPLVPWYLQQLRAYEQAHGVRLLDYLDLHYYPQASNVALSDAVDTATQALRLRSTRSLWDATYADESWINGTEGGPAVRLIPRMREWVNANYPGTKVAISEYNWGAPGHINGALAQADVLGIFGRENLDLATLWDPPKTNQALAYAFRMYRNYDGAGSAFGQTSVRATSADQDQLAVYAAQDARSLALTVMVINKTNSAQTAQVSIANFPVRSPALVYRYSNTNLTAIVRAANQTLSGGAFAANVPATSITLYVIPNTAAPNYTPRAFVPLVLR
jgi:hypothetical protein